MKKNESKSKKTQPVETLETPNTQSETRTDVERPADTPSDGEGCESVTVIIVTDNEIHGELMAHSVKKNLIGVDADIHLVTGENLRNTLVETLMEHMPHVKTERIILMTDSMVILNPVTIYEIGVRKAVQITPNLLSFQTNTPMLMHKSVLLPLLDDMRQNSPYADVMDTYGQCVNTDVEPLIMKPWNADRWLLPVVSKAPFASTIAHWAATQRFMHIQSRPWPNTVEKFLEDRFGM